MLPHLNHHFRNLYALTKGREVDKLELNLDGFAEL